MMAFKLCFAFVFLCSLLVGPVIVEDGKVRTLNYSCRAGKCKVSEMTFELCQFHYNWSTLYAGLYCIHGEFTPQKSRRACSEPSRGSFVCSGKVSNEIFKFENLFVLLYLLVFDFSFPISETLQSQPRKAITGV